MFKFSQSSLNKLNKVDKRLQLLAHKVLKISPYDFAITEGLRTLEKQQEYFNKGASKCDGIKNKSKHQEGKAIDIMVYNEQGVGTWEEKYYYQIAEIFKSMAQQLNINIKCGIDFKGFVDGPHIELV